MGYGESGKLLLLSAQLLTVYSNREIERERPRRSHSESSSPGEKSLCEGTVNRRIVGESE